VEIGKISGRVSLDSKEFTTAISQCVASLNTLKASVGASTMTLPKMGEEAKAAAGGVTLLDGACKSLMSTIKPLVAIFGVWKIAGFLKDSGMMSARVEQLGIMMRRLGANIGYSADQMENYAKAIEAKGITEEASRQSILRLIQANVDLGEAANIARIAQDAAKVGNINSSEAMQTVSMALATGMSRQLRYMGLTVNFGKAEAAMRRELGRALTDEEMKLARVNELKRASISIQGAYEAGFSTTAGQIQSFARHLDNFKNNLGKAFTPMMATLIGEITESIKGMTTELKSGGGVEAFGKRMQLFLIDAIAGWVSLKIAMKGVLTAAVALAQVPLILPKQQSLLSGDTHALSKAYDSLEDLSSKIATSIEQDQAKLDRLAEKRYAAENNLGPKFVWDIKQKEKALPETIVDEKATKQSVERITQWFNELNGKMAASGLSNLDKLLVEAETKYKDLQAMLKDSKSGSEAQKQLDKVYGQAPGLIKQGFFAGEFDKTKSYLKELQTALDGLSAGEGMNEFQRKIAEIPSEIEKQFAELDRDISKGTFADHQKYIADRQAATELRTKTVTQEYANRLIGQAKESANRSREDLAAAMADLGVDPLQAEINKAIRDIEKSFDKDMANLSSLSDGGAAVLDAISAAKDDARARVIGQSIAKMQMSLDEFNKQNSMQLDSNAAYREFASGMSWKDNFFGGANALLRQSIANSPESMMLQKQIDSTKNQIFNSDSSSERFATLNKELDKLIEKRNKLNEGKFQLIKDEEANATIANIRKITQGTVIAKEMADAFTGPLTDALTSFATTGKLNFKQLGADLLKTMQMMAAQKTAILLMEAAYQGIMVLADPIFSSIHAMAADMALTGAAIMGSFVLGSGLAGMAHSGMSNIPEDGTWMLKKGERVVDSNTNADLKEYLKDSKSKGPVNVTVNINNSDEQGVMNALPAMKQAIIDAVSGNIASGGAIKKSIMAYAR